FVYQWSKCLQESAWMFRLISPVPPARNALLLGEFATKPFTSIASTDGSRLVKCVQWGCGFEGMLQSPHQRYVVQYAAFS
ncbi:hypothetical protein AALP_AAs48608U000100, partial [Arabis alpina]